MTGGRPGTPTDTSIPLYELDWGAQYLDCSEWRDVYISFQGLESEWLEGYQCKGNRIIESGKICVPTPLQERVIYDNHLFLGHVGFYRIWEHMNLRFQWGDILSAKNLLGRLWICV